MILLVGFNNNETLSKTCKNLLAEVYDKDYTSCVMFASKFNNLADELTHHEDAKYGGDISYIDGKSERELINSLSNTEQGLKLCLKETITSLLNNIKNSEGVCRTAIHIIDGLSGAKDTSALISKMGNDFKSDGSKYDLGKTRIILGPALKKEDKDKLTELAEEVFDASDGVKEIKSFFEEKKKLKIFL